MPEPSGGPGPRIVVGVDGSPSSLAALKWAIRQARLAGGSVDAVTAWEYPGGAGGFGWSPGAAFATTDLASVAEKTLSEATATALAEADWVSVRQLVREGHPARVLMDAAEGADLLVVGSRGHGGFAGMLLGSVSPHCVRHASVPVLVIR